MNIVQIQYLLSAVSLHSIHKAAEKYNISPQGASKAIRMLEQELGIVLMERSTKGVFLTEDGAKILDKFQAILDNYEEIRQFCDALNLMPNLKSIQGEILLAVTPRFADSYLGKWLFNFNEIYPKIKVKVDAMSNDKIFERMSGTHGAFDVAIINIVNLEPNIDQLGSYLLKNNLQFVAYCTKELYMCGKKTLLENIGPTYSIESSASIYPVVAYEYGGVVGSFRADYEYQINSISPQLELINKQNILGAYSLDEFKLHFNSRKHGYIPFDTPVTLTYGCLLNGNHPLSEAEKIFLQYLLDYFE